MNEAFDAAAKGYDKMVKDMQASNNILIASLGDALDALGKFAAGQDLVQTAHAPEAETGQRKFKWEVGEDGKMTTVPVGSSGFTMFDAQDLVNGKGVPGQKGNVDSQNLADTTKTLEEWNKQLENNAYYQKEIADKTSQLTTTLDNYEQVLTSVGLREELRHVGAQQALADMAAEGLNVIHNEGYYRKYNEVLDSNVGKQFEIAKARQAQIEAASKERAESFALIGTYQELQTQISTGTAIEDAYRTGLYETNIALLEREKELSKSTGSLDAYNNAIVSGQVQNIAFAEGVNKQRENLYGMIEATATASGEITELTSQLHAGTIQSAAFNQAYVETQLAIQKGNVEIAAGQGAFNAWVLAAGQGEIALQSFQKGVLAQNDALAKSYEAVYQSIGALHQYNAQLETGLPQGIAFTQTMVDMSRAASEQEVELAKASASLQFHKQSIGEAAGEIRDAVVDMNTTWSEGTASMQEFSTKTALAFTQGRDSVYEWRDSLIEAQHAEVGAHMEAAILADTMGIKIPAGFKGGSAEVMNFIAIASRIPQALAPIR